MNQPLSHQPLSHQPAHQPGDLSATAAPAADAQGPAAPYASNLCYLDDELAWIELRCRRLGAERRLRGSDMSTDRHGRPVRAAYSDTPDPEELPRLRKAAKALREREQRLRQRIDARLLAHRGSGAPALALDELCALYGLDDFERSVVLLAAAPCFSRSFGERFAELQGPGLGHSLEVETVFNFHELGFTDRIAMRAAFLSAGRLVSNDLIGVQFPGRYTSPQDLLQTDIEITPRTFSALLGEDALPAEFMEFSSLETPKARLEQVVLAPADKARILSVVERHDSWLERRRDWGIDARIPYGRGVFMLFHGASGTGKTMTAHAIADRLGKRVLNVDIPTFVESRDADRFLPGLFREARLQNALLFFDECEVIFGDRRRGNALMTLLLTEMERFEGIAVLATNLPEALDAALERRLLVKVRFPKPDRAARRAIWRWHLPPATPLAADVALDVLADRFELTGGLIKNAVLMAVAAAVHDGADAADPRITMGHLEEAARDQLRGPQQADDQLSWPEVRRDQVVLGARLSAQVDALVATARNGRTVLERWGVGQHLSRGKGVVALLSGAPGTGKTLTAEAIAAELGRPLMAIGASSVLSKWVGETERHLEALFKTCRDRGAVLFLDECDDLLAARDAERNGGWSVAVVTTLLRLLERHDGVTLLATNRPDALDPALTRRLSHHLRFDLPGAAARELIWRGLLPETVPREEPLDFGAVARRFPLSGAAIQNAAFRAAYRAAREERGLRQSDLEAAAVVEAPAEVAPDDACAWLAEVGVEA